MNQSEFDNFVCPIDNDLDYVDEPESNVPIVPLDSETIAKLKRSKPGCDSFTLTINLPDTPIKVFNPKLIETAFESHMNKTGIKTEYLLFEEKGNDPPNSSHYHLWCHSDAPIRTDNLIRDYFKPIVRTLGFADYNCKGKVNGRLVYIAIKASKIRDSKNKWNDFAYSLGYVCKEKDMKTNSFTMDNCYKEENHPIINLFTFSQMDNIQRDSWSPLMDTLIDKCVQYRINCKAIYKIKTKNISAHKTRDFLDEKYPNEDNWTEACLKAIKAGYQMHILKDSVRMAGDRLSREQVIYIYQLFKDPLPEFFVKYLAHKESMKRKRHPVHNAGQYRYRYARQRFNQ